MTLRNRRYATALLVAIALPIMASCGAPRLSMRDAPARTIPPPSEGTARVVFAAPSALRDVLTIVDERGRYLGQLGGRTFTTIEVEPGERKFYALVDASEYAVGGALEAGRTYWVLAERPVSRNLRWISWAPRCDEDLAARLQGTRAVEIDPGAERGAIERQLGDVPQRILEADAELAAMSTADRSARTLAPQPLCDAAPAEPTSGSEASATESVVGQP